MRRSVLLVAAVVCATLLPGTVLAARQWDLTATPLSLVVGVKTAVRLTATNLSSSGSGMTCVQVQVNPSFTVSSVAVVSIKGQTSGADFLAWTAVWSGGTTVAFKSTLGTSRLKQDDDAVFMITGTASTVGTVAWAGGASDKAGLPASSSCPSGTYPATALQFTVRSTPTPSPSPSPSPSPTPTPAPTPRPTPSTQPSSIPGPTEAPTTEPGSTPGPSDTAAPSATPGESVGPSTAPDFSTEPSTPVPGPPTAPGSGSDPPSSGGFAIANQEDRPGPIPVNGLDGAVMTALNSLPGGVFAFAFPAFALTVPGLLLILAVGAQALGALAWLPLVRRRLGGFGFRRLRDR